MHKDGRAYLTETAFQHPALEALDRLANELLGIGLCVVFPQTDGWGQFYPRGDGVRSDMCRMMQADPDGLKRCRMCHVLMSVASCSQQSPLEQTCHAGMSVLVVPATVARDECFAVLSTCVFLDTSKPIPWSEAKKRLARLDLNMHAARKAYDRLPRLNSSQIKLAENIMEIAAQIVGLIRDRAEADARTEATRRRDGPREDVRAMIEERLQSSLATAQETNSAPANSNRTHPPLLLQVITELIGRRPEVPYSVSEVAAAARLSPNHFSTLFHKHMKQSFSDYLLDKRIELAKEVLRDLTMNITEVAIRVGYDDPGYFARRFKTKTGLSPREWRQQLAPI